MRLRNYNRANRLIAVNVQREIYSNPTTYALWNARLAILKKEPQVGVPPPTVEFFTLYAQAYKSPSRIVADAMLPFNTPVTKNMCIMYSGGSESIMMDQMFNDIDLIHGYRFYPYKSLWREFQIALLGLAKGYATTMCGIQPAMLPDPHITYELSRAFVRSWNKTFACKLQYPLTMSKDEIYEWLFAHVDPDTKLFSDSGRPLRIITCDLKEPCGKCWKCAEQHFFLEGLRYTTKWDDVIYDYPVNQDALARYREDNELFFQNDTDPYGTMGMLKMMEEAWGYTGWRQPIRPVRMRKNNAN